MKRNIKLASAVLAVVLVAGISMTERGQQVSRAMLQSLGAASAGAGRYQVKILLQTSDGRSYEYSDALSDSDFRELRDRPENARDKFVMTAKKAMAEKMGYHEARYGADHYKMLSGPRLMAFQIVDPSTNRVQDMFRDERRQGAFASIYAE